MGKSILGRSLVVGLLFTVSLSWAQNFSIEDFNKALIVNGVAWKAGHPTYEPSFYTGFAPRIEDANKIHFHLSRGNQIRLTAPIDDYSVLTYLYSLKAREKFVDGVVAKGLAKLTQQDQWGLYKAILASGNYGVGQLVSQLDNGAISNQDFYARSLQIMQQLNPGRIFQIRLNMSAYVQRWGKSIDDFTFAARGDVGGFIDSNSDKTVVLVNELVPGRVNLFFVSADIKAKILEVLAVRQDAAAFQTKALELFNLATQKRYVFNVLRNGQLQSSFYQNASGATILEYPEFTAIYPNGSVKDYTKDRDGNKIPVLREIGVLNFIERNYHDVDHIRSESYYGYVPKMDYTTTGNGIHNPAVRTSLRSSVYKSLYQALNIPAQNDTLWIVSRGGVSHGCTRMSIGHLLEVRNIFPAAESQMVKLNYFGNVSQDYDVFDVDGNGQPEVMGVKYFLAYAIASDSGEGYREGAGLIDQSLNRDTFYGFLYGQKQFRIENGKYIFINPYISQFAKKKSSDVRGGAFSIKLSGEFDLYEQDYEKDKIQFFSMSSSQMSSLNQSNDHTSTGKTVCSIVWPRIWLRPL